VFERFTHRARLVVVFAQEEARDLNHNYIGTEHILLGLIREADGVAARALGGLGISLDSTRTIVLEIVGRGEATPAGQIPFTPRAKHVLELGLKESKKLGDSFIATEHILLGIVREGEGVAAQVLRSAGVDKQSLLERIVELRESEAIVEFSGGVARHVRLRAMTPDEFDGYLSWVVDDYAAELERNGKAIGEAAVEASRASFASLLSDGVETPGQVLLIAEDPEEGARVGVLWFGPSTDDPAVAWIYDVTIDPDQRGQGWGRAALRAFEGEARARGYARAGLSVYADNHVARRLYESMGYVETARQLHKKLGDEDPLVS
jgi:ribosomal protein S18 acetylase RimI-like enzyme